MTQTSRYSLRAPTDLDMSWIQVNQTQLVEAAAPPASIQYRLIIEITNANEIEPELFVFNVSDDAYSHVAAFRDLQIYPNSKAKAQAEDALFYRSTKIQLIFTDQERAYNAATGIQARLKRANADWGSSKTTPFGGVETFVYDSREP